MVARTGVLLGSAALAILLFVTNVTAARLAKPGSTHPSFPMDVFSKPAYRLIYANDDPISNHSAVDLLVRYGGDQAKADLETLDHGKSHEQQESTPAKVFLERTFPDTLHLCSVQKAKPARPKLEVERGTLDQQRSRILRRAIELLSPLKETCLYHTLDWFTYSFCYGDAIRQFRALPGTTLPGKTPAIDSREDSYVLGRWNDGIEVIDGLSHAQPSRSSDSDQNAPSSTDDVEAQPMTTTDAAATNDGTELMELVRFPSLYSSSSSRKSVERNAHVSAEQVIDGGDGRYVSQVWSSGTLCNINNEPRTTEVQFHCSSSPPVDRISLIKETTTCNYVVVIETPKLCEEPALAPAEEDIREVRCRPILSDQALEAHQKAKRSQPPKEKADLPSGFKIPSGFPLDNEKLKKVLQVANSIAAKKTNQAGDSKDGFASIPDIELVVGYDAEGRIMIEPRNGQGDVIRDENIASAASTEQTEGTVQHPTFVDTNADNDAALNANKDKAASQDPKAKWDQLVARFLQLEEEIFDGLELDGIAPEEYFVMERLEGDEYLQQGEDAPGEQERKEKKLPRHMTPRSDSEQSSGKETNNPGPGSVAGSTDKDDNVGEKMSSNNKKEDIPPSRGSTPHMVRETETFAQKVERHYKFQEDQERGQQQGSEKEAQSVAADEKGGHRDRTEL